MRNTNMRKGFTMIELIFVIVIIGILAAVAIPKLSATRDDAKISNIVANARTALGDMTAKYTALGRDGFALSDIIAVTNVPFKTDCATASQVVSGAKIAGATLLLCDSAVECLRFVIDANATQVSVTPKDSTAQISPVCEGVFDDAAIISIGGGTTAVAKVHAFGGSLVNRN